MSSETIERKSRIKAADKAFIDGFLAKASGFDEPKGDPRTKQVVHRLLSDLCVAIDDLDISMEEFWHAVDYVGWLGEQREGALLTAGLGLEHFFDLRADLEDAQAGIEGGTPRTIEGPLYVAGAPLLEGEGRLDDGSDPGEALYMHGQVRDEQGRPLAGAQVEVWHANTKGNYSFFDSTQSDYNMRRTIVTDAQGRYAFRSILPNGYGCPPQGPTQALLDRLGRHGNRPAHIHFFVHAERHRHLTTQINIEDDPLVNDDFAFATRDGLIPPVVRHPTADIEGAARLGIEGAFAEIEFDFVLHRARDAEEQRPVMRSRAQVAG
ncbi:catechol 1,2-dioxygenase [Halotalea alkalilenta]|uniref:catechol 1,2-dioxygenase n=1 Tax=Halotalea alkalilenta TaxID=376489 RepID=UPI0009DFCE59|nr:catechol 1,2-dioxygenase [Halotalea alkalilenta]